MPFDRTNAFKMLYEQHQECSPCPFGKQEANHKVFGEGNSTAILMFIGEAPGAQEDLLKRPFVGRSGKLLDKIFAVAGFERKDIYITNIVKCRPPENRTPLPEEISPAMKQLLKDEIPLVQPQVICTLGAVATRFFLPEMTTMSRTRGNPIILPHSNIHLFPAFHPAYALRNKDAEKMLEHDIIAAYRLAKKLQAVQEK